jgi:DNA polymerase III subunit beta
VKLRCERDVLVDALSTAGRAVASRGGALPVLSGARMEVEGDRLHVAGSDLDLTIQVDIAVAGGGDGVCVVPARLAADIVRALDPGAVSVEAGEDEVRITSGRSHFAVRMLPAAEFPRLLTSQAVGEGVTLDAAELAEALRQVVRAASSDDARPLLTGVLMTADEGGLRLVATDSYRLAMRELAGTSVLREGQKVLVPSKALAELQRLLAGAEHVTLHLGERDASFAVGDVRLTTRLIEGDYPNYRQLIPSNNPNRLTVGKEALLDAVRRVKLLARDATTSVRIALRSEVIELTVITHDIGQATEDIDAKYEGNEMTVAFNPAYLIDGIEAIDGDEIVLETIDGQRAAVIRPTEGNEYVYLLMPIRVP